MLRPTLLIAFFASGCGNVVCEDAADIVARCGVVPEALAGGSDCTGEDARRAQCIVDYEPEYCSMANGTALPENDLTKCLADS